MSISVELAFKKLKSDLELDSTLQQAITTHHTAIRQWLESYDKNIETKLIGSLQRKTRIKPRRGKDKFDIDILVVLGKFDKWVSGGITPLDAMNTVDDVLSENKTYNRLGPKQDSPAISYKYKDEIEVELIPAYKDGIGYWPNGIPSTPIDRGYWIPVNRRWEMADYDYDAAHISLINGLNNSQIIPSIKILKAIKRNLFPDLKSYHLEVMATSIIPQILPTIESYNIPCTLPFILYGFFLYAGKEIFKNSMLPGSKSINVTSYLSSKRKLEMSGQFNKLCSYISNLVGKEGGEILKNWHKVIDEPFYSGG